MVLVMANYKTNAVILKEENSMDRFSSDQSVGEIVTILPKAGEIFKQYRIDFCCGGHRPLKEVIQEQNLNENEVLQALDVALKEQKEMREQARDFREMTPGALVDYIVNTHHTFLWENIPEISELTTTIMKVHGQNHPELFRVHKLFSMLRSELEQHLTKEEELLFPMIEEYDGKPSGELLQKIRETVKETEEEHDAAGDIVKELRKITEDYKVPGDACGTFALTYQKIEELESDLFQHIHLENNILFKRLNIEV